MLSSAEALARACQDISSFADPRAGVHGCYNAVVTVGTSRLGVPHLVDGEWISEYVIPMQCAMHYEQIPLHDDEETSRTSDDECPQAQS